MKKKVNHHQKVYDQIQLLAAYKNIQKKMKCCLKDQKQNKACKEEGEIKGKRVRERMVSTSFEI